MLKFTEVPTNSEPIAQGIATKLARETPDAIVIYAPAAVSDQLLKRVPGWEAAQVLEFLQTQPPREIGPVLGSIIANCIPRDTTRLLVVTCPPMKFSPMFKWDTVDPGLDLCAVAHRQYLCRAMTAEIKPAADIGSRKETRLRDGNMWSVAHAPDKWVWSLLPPGHRATVVFGNNGLTSWIFTRLDSTPIARAPWTASCNAVLDCVINSQDSFFVYDAIGVAGRRVGASGLYERMGAAMTAFKSQYCSGFAEYRPASVEMIAAGKGMQHGDGRRLLFVDPIVPYKPSANSRDAFSWRPPLPRNHAILCCRVGEALSLAAENMCLLWLEGPVTGAEGHMRCYECEYDSTTQRWAAVRQAKRGEPLYTREQVFALRQGAASPNSLEELAAAYRQARKSPKITTKKVQDEEGFIAVTRRKK